ncbi:MAG: hypothetical protein NVSMB47_12290 [Polyangiales bacterium]
MASAPSSVRRDDLQAKAPELRRLDVLDEAWTLRSHGKRHDAVRAGAHALRQSIVAGPRVAAVRTLPLVRAPYGTKLAFRGAAWSPAPFVMVDHRALLVQFMQHGAPKTLLFNPTDLAGARSTPYFAKIAAATPKLVEGLLSPPFPSLEAQLAAHGLSCADVDYVAYDHFHVQDLRPIVGTADGAVAARFPNAKLLAPRVEWDDWERLHPLQRAFYVEAGRSGLDLRNVVLTDGDVALGDGVLLVRTPGHTSGNQTLFVSTERGVWGCSENGVCVDNWSPLDSRIPGLRAYAAHHDLDLVLNLNTPEAGSDQYTSMTLERLVVDRVPHAPAFVQMFASSEATDSPLAPGLAPTVRFGALESGRVLPRLASNDGKTAAARPSAGAV